MGSATGSPALAQLHLIIQAYQPNVIIGTETWLTPGIDSAQFFSPPFSMTAIKTARLTEVAVPSPPSQNSKPRPDLDTNCKIARIHFQLSTWKSRLAAFYRPPSTNTGYLQNLETSLSRTIADKNIDRGRFQPPQHALDCFVPP